MKATSFLYLLILNAKNVDTNSMIAKSLTHTSTIHEVFRLKDVETDSLAMGTLRITLAACALRLGIPCGALLTKTINAIDFVTKVKQVM